ncbi:MAG: BTAD domain-containing putative transcriptional regulator [Dehalococcoidia bacterium]|nr:BTAD domain-containing putative transcriptional regulator [Dehalococcoidia bacterium]
MELSRRVNEIPMIARLLTKVGIAHIIRDDLPTADRLIRQAFGECQGQTDQSISPHYEFSAGLLAFRCKDLQRAIGHLSRACNGFKSGGDKVELARAHYHLANVYLSRNDLEKAEKQMRVVDQMISISSGEGYLLADIRRQPEPIEFAVSRRIGLIWIERARERLGLRGKPAQSIFQIGELTPEASNGAPESVQVFSLGNSKVVCGGRQIAESDWTTQITKELFFYLAAQPRGARKEEIVDALWPDLSPARARSNFHGTLYRLRRATTSDLVLQQGGRYFLNPAVDVWHDVEEFEKCISEALRYGTKSEDAIPFWEKATNIYQGGFLVQFYSEWCETRRKSLEEHYLQALGTLARYHQSIGNFATSASHYEKALVVDPFAEEVHRQILTVYDLAGDRPSAIRHYNRLVQTLRDELDTDPEPETMALFNSLVGKAKPGSRGREPISSNKGV